MFEGMEAIELEHDGTRLRGYAASPAGTERSPAVLVMHSAIGIAHEVNERTAHKLARRGYVAVCTDMYGAELEGAALDQYSRAYAQNLAEPEKQRERIVAWFDRIATRPDVDDERIAAVGFCYGGMTVLARAQRRERQGGHQLPRDARHTRTGSTRRSPGSRRRVLWRGRSLRVPRRRRQPPQRDDRGRGAELPDHRLRCRGPRIHGPGGGEPGPRGRPIRRAVERPVLAEHTGRVAARVRGLSDHACRGPRAATITDER